MSNLSFEGEKIDHMTVTIRQAKLDIKEPYARGEVVELKIMVEVSEVSVRENRRNGSIVRDHIVHVKEVI